MSVCDFVKYETTKYSDSSDLSMKNEEKGLAVFLVKVSDLVYTQ